MPARRENLYLLQDLAIYPKTKRLSNDELQALRKIADWTRDFVSRPHVNLGREGPVCPFVPPAIENNTLWLAVEHVDGLSELEVAVLLNSYKELFLSLHPREEEVGTDIAARKTILIIFCDLEEDKASNYVDGIQRALKDGFVRQGLMLGEFHIRSESPGTHNENFFPLQSPLPMLVIRHMVVTDWRFLYTKPEWVQAWLARFHNGVDARVLVLHLRNLARAIEEAAEPQKEEKQGKAEAQQHQEEGRPVR